MFYMTFNNFDEIVFCKRWDYQIAHPTLALHCFWCENEWVYY